VIDADDEVVADLLASSIQALLDHGGWLNPRARILARAGHLTVECDADDGDVLVVVPRAAMLPVRRVSWSTRSDVLAIDNLDRWPDQADLGLLVTQVGLHNSAGKPRQVREAHPTIASIGTRTHAALRALVPGFRSGALTMAETFWATRTYRLPAFDSDPEPVVLAVLDLIDHHPRGATADWNSGSLSVAVAHPTGTTECFLDYGMQRDALEMAVVYGFADLANPHAHSAPLRFVHPETGTVEIGEIARTSRGTVRPIEIDYVEGEWRISHLPLAAASLIPDVADASDMSTDWAATVVACARALNVELLEELHTALDREPPSPVVKVLKGAAQRQRANLEARA
jgi:hypothetical protein